MRRLDNLTPAVGPAPSPRRFNEEKRAVLREPSISPAHRHQLEQHINTVPQGRVMAGTVRRAWFDKASEILTQDYQSPDHDPSITMRRGRG